MKGLSLFWKQNFERILYNLIHAEVDKGQEWKEGYKEALNKVKENFDAEIQTQLEESDQFAAAAKPISLSSEPHARSRIYRAEPTSWEINDTGATEVLKAILAKKTQNNAVVFDLDGTLFDVGPRTVGILKEWLKTEEAKDCDPYYLKILEEVSVVHLGYSLFHLFENAGFDMNLPPVFKIYERVQKYWNRRFFDGDSLVEYDTVFPGALEFVEALQKEGINIVYLTGRHQHQMREGTIAQLKKWNFPVTEENVHLKTNPAMDDQLFKGAKFAEIMKKFDVIANFENEYPNLNSMFRNNKEAVHVIMDSQHSGRRVPDDNLKIFRITHFQMD